MSKKSQLEKEYLEIFNREEKNIKQLEELSKDEKIIKYLNLISENESLVIKKRELNKKIKFLTYDECNHIWVQVLVDRDFLKGRNIYYYGCIKCGLNEKSLFVANNCSDELYSEDDRIMYEYLKEYPQDHSLIYDTYCNLPFAKDLYKQIKQRHPNIDDEEVIRHFATALIAMQESEKTKQKSL